MRIQKEEKGTRLIPEYQKYIATVGEEDKDRLVFLSLLIPSWESVDNYTEIDESEAERIKKAKAAAHGSVEYQEMEVNQALSLMTLKINDMQLTDAQALQYKNLYPKWETFINGKLEKDYKVLYDDKLYKVKQTIETVLENQPPSIDTAALYEEINEKNQGTSEDPIPYNNNMELFAGKYYSQNGVTYKCTRNTEQPVYQDLSALVGIYVEKVEE